MSLRQRGTRTFGVVGAPFVALFVAIACAPGAETVSGRITKHIDGDSFEIGATEIRLFGVDAFEGRQACSRGGVPWDCGAAAADKLRELASNRELVCEKRDTDTYGRTVAVCRAGGVDLGAEMVRSGLALAYRRYSSDYVDEEREAQTARRGAWAGEFLSPERDRRNGSDERRPAERGDDGRQAAAASCRGSGVKGNISADGDRIYHVPGSSAYAATVIDESKGERWFCTEEDALRNGWRAPRRR
jgi:endonuclease YncB( thermonuclease family)